MTSRALIIAIERYPRIDQGGLADILPGTLAAANRFRAWLEQRWQSDQGRNPPETQLLFCSEPQVAGGRGASREDLITALEDLKTAGRNMTEELFFYFSGHGFCFEGTPGSRSDVLVTADFKNGKVSSASCFKLDEIVGWLQTNMGIGHHFHFIDACRNILKPNSVQVGLQLQQDAQDSEESTIYVLQSTVRGAPALVGGPFASTLEAGLRGAGKAKIWQLPMADAMVVNYESLRRFLKERLASRQPITHWVAGEDGEADAILAKIKPVPLCNLTVNLASAHTGLTGTLFLKRSTSPAETAHAFDQQRLVLALEPDFYTVRLNLPATQVLPAGEAPVELFEDATVEFKPLLGGGWDGDGEIGGASSESLAAQVDLLVPQGSEVALHNVETGIKSFFERSVTAALTPGTYAVTFNTPHGPALLRREIYLQPGERTVLNPAAWGDSIPHQSIARLLPAAQDGLDFSESLGGPIADPDLDLWLTLLGGGRILGSQGDYSKIATLPLGNFSQIAQGGSPLYVLAGFEQPATTLKVAVTELKVPATPEASPQIAGATASLVWQSAAEPTAMPGIRHAVFAPRSGGMLVSLQVDDMAPSTVASFAIPNRGTLIVLTLDEEHVPRVSQFLLPLGHLLGSLPTGMQQMLAGRNALQDLRFLAQLSRAFRRRRRLETDVSDARLDQALSIKWVDPIGACLAAFELVRRRRRQALPEVVANLTAYFPDLPDTAALARIAGGSEAGRQPTGVPLFLDGLRAFPDFAQWLPLPAGHLDFGAAFTTWLAAVEPPPGP